MGNDNNEIKENISEEKVAAESVAAESVVTETEATDEAPKTDSKMSDGTDADSSDKAYEEESKHIRDLLKDYDEKEKASEEPVFDDSDEDLEPVDLNSDDFLTQEKKSKNSRDRRSPDEEDDEEKDKPARPVRRREKKPVDQYKKKRVRKNIRIIVILLILVLAGFLLYFMYIKPRVEMAKNMLNNMVQEQTDTVEKRDITEAITTTGTIEASEVRTLTSTAKDTTIDAVMASVGDMVNEGDTLVMFSTENINKTIEQLQEDLAKQKKKDAIDSQASDRNYLYTYANQSLELSTAAEKVNTTLKDLYEACDGYGTAKRELQAAKDAGPASGDPVDVERYNSQISQLESAVTNAYQREQAAQVAYDAAVDAQAQLISRSSNTLTEADENKQKSAISAGDQATNLARQIEDYQDKLENYVITAPISGLVTSVSVEEGNGFSGGTVMVIQDTETLKITTQIDEYDIPDIKLGQRVVIKTDATRDDELMGYVSFIAPTSSSMATGGASSSTSAASMSSSQSSSPTFEVTITIITKDERLKIGMSAKLNIVVDQVSNVLTVPYDAIMTNAQGENYITVIEKSGGSSTNAGQNTGQNAGGNMPVISVNGQTVSGGSQNAFSGNSGNGGPGKGGNNTNGQMPNDNRRDIKVTIGMEGDYYTQVISDELEEGMTVVIPDSGNFGGLDFGAMMGGSGGF